MKCHSHQSEKNTIWPSVLVNCVYPFMYESNSILAGWFMIISCWMFVVNPSCLSITLNAILFSVEETWGIIFKIFLTLYGCLSFYNSSLTRSSFTLVFRQIQSHTFFNSSETGLVLPHNPDIKGITILWKINTVILQ